MLNNTVLDNEETNTVNIPELALLEEEFAAYQERKKKRQTILRTMGVLATVSAAAVLVAILFLPVLRVYGSSMTPTLKQGSIVLSVKAKDIEIGDVIAFYNNNRIIVKRAVAQAGDWVDIDSEGNVYINGELTDEPYVSDKALGDCDIELPYQVPENKIFVLGDHRSVSIDSRNTSIGPVEKSKVVGKLIYCVWPMEHRGKIK